MIVRTKIKGSGLGEDFLAKKKATMKVVSEQ